MKNGWHKVYGYDVYLEYNRIDRVTNFTHTKILHVYRVEKNYLVRCTDVHINTFRNNVKKGKMVIC